MIQPKAPTRGTVPFGAFLAWAAVGAALCTGVLGAMTFGFLLLPLAAAGAFFLSRWQAGRGGALPGLVAGPAAPLWLIAWLNRAGPGNICSTSGGVNTCITEWSPWPWVVAGLVAMGIGIGIWLRRRATDLRFGTATAL